MTPTKAPLPFLGAWTLTECLSSRSDLPYPTSGTATFTQQEDGISYINESVWSDGRTTKSSVVFQLDGDWSPVAGAMLHDSMCLRHLEGGSFEFRMRKGGIDVGSCLATILAETRTLTANWEFVGPGGTKITWKTTSVRQ
jgi:hypothetical protein